MLALTLDRSHIPSQAETQGVLGMEPSREVAFARSATCHREGAGRRGLRGGTFFRHGILGVPTTQVNDS